MDKKANLITTDNIEQLIFLIRGEKVMLSAHLADLYGVESRVLVQAVKRNIDRFPEDFMFQLTDKEFNNLHKFNFKLGWYTQGKAIRLYRTRGCNALQCSEKQACGAG